MSAIVALNHMASAVVVRTLLDHSDRHSHECQAKAQSLIAKLRTDLYTAVSKDLLDFFVDNYPRQLPPFLLPVLAPPHLRVLSLKQCCLIEEDSQEEFKYLKETLTRCSKLESLELDGCNLASPLSLCDVIIQHASQLVSISLEECCGVSNEFVQKLLRGLPNLSHLNLSICPEVTDNVFALSETQGLLEERDVAQDTASGGCNLSSVDLSGNQQLTSTCIRHLTELCGPRLRNLNVAATRMDCTILWFLSGYSLSTAVQLAAEANKTVMDDNSGDGVSLADLITEFRLLQERLKNLQEEECQRQEETQRVTEEGRKKEGDGNKDLMAEEARAAGEEEMEDGRKAGREQEQDMEAKGGSLEDTMRRKEENVKVVEEQREVDVDNRAFGDGTNEDKLQTEEENKQKMEDEEGSLEENGKARWEEMLQCKDKDADRKMEETQNAARGSLEKTELRKDDILVHDSVDGEMQECKAEDEKQNLGNVQQESLVAGDVTETKEALTNHENLSKEERAEGIQDSLVVASYSDDSKDELDVAVGCYVNGIVDDCCRTLWIERNQNLAIDEHFPHSHYRTNSAESCICNCKSFSYAQHEEISGQSESSAEVRIKVQCPLCQTAREPRDEKGQRPSSDQLEGDTSKGTCFKFDDAEEAQGKTFLGKNAAGGKCTNSSDESSLDRRTVFGDRTLDFELTLERTCSGIPEGNLCHSSLVKSANSVSKLSHTNRTCDGDSKSSIPGTSANEAPDGNSPPIHALKTNFSNDVCKSGHVEPTNGSGCKSSQPPILANDGQDDIKVTISPWRRLYTPCITSLDVGIIDFDAVLVVTCLQEFFLANRQLRRLTVCWKELTDSMLEIIASGGAELRSLCLVDCSSLTSLGVANLLSKCHKLQQLDLQGVCYLTDAALMPLFLQGNSCNLHTLKLSETNISDSTLTRIAKYLGNKITTLEISWCEEISDHGVSEIAKHCTALEVLTLRQCCISADTLMSLAWNCSGLATLNMSGVENLTDGVVQAMMPSLRQLKKLDMSWNSELTDTAISSVLSCCPLVVELYLMGLKRITEKPFMPLISELEKWQRCKRLIKLKMKERTLLERLGEDTFSSDEEYEDLFAPVRSTTYAPCLRILELQYCDRVNDDLLAELVAICVGRLSIVDYYGMQIKPKLLQADNTHVV